MMLKKTIYKKNLQGIHFTGTAVCKDDDILMLLKVKIKKAKSKK